MTTVRDVIAAVNRVERKRRALRAHSAKRLAMPLAQWDDRRVKLEGRLFAAMDILTDAIRHCEVR